MTSTPREIGPVGTAARVLTALALFFIAGGATFSSWSLDLDDVLIGLVALPAIVVALGLVAQRFHPGPIRLTGPLGVALNLAVIVALVLTALALFFIAGGATFSSWSLDLDDVLIGLVALPAIVVALGLVAQRFHPGPIRLTGPLGVALNLAVIVALIANDLTGPEGTVIFYGATMLIAAFRGQAGCEVTVVSNLILDRGDQIGCPMFEPIDELEAHFRSRQAIATK